MKRISQLLVCTTATLLMAALSGCMSLGSGKGNFAAHRTATGRKVFIFDPRQHAWALYNRQGELMRTGPASGGKNYCKNLGRPCRTVVGKFTVYREKGTECVSSKFPLGKGGAPMPNCMFFYKGYAIHGSYDVPHGHASHGCIRVKADAAAWLNSHINPGATVIVRPY